MYELRGVAGSCGELRGIAGIAGMRNEEDGEKKKKEGIEVEREQRRGAIIRDRMRQA